MGLIRADGAVENVDLRPQTDASRKHREQADTSDVRGGAQQGTRWQAPLSPRSQLSQLSQLSSPSDEANAPRQVGFLSRLFGGHKGSRGRGVGRSAAGCRDETSRGECYAAATPPRPPPQPAARNSPSSSRQCEEPQQRRRPQTSSGRFDGGGGSHRGFGNGYGYGVPQATATFVDSPDVDVVYLAPLQFRGTGSTDSLRSSRSDNSTANLRWTAFGSKRSLPLPDGGGGGGGGYSDDYLPSPPVSEWIVPVAARRVAFQMPQKAMHGRRHGGGGTGISKAHHRQSRRTKSAHASGHSKRAHGRRVKRPAAHSRYHLRRRYLLHGGALGAEAQAAAGVAGLYGLGEDLFEEGEDSEMLRMRFHDTDSEEEEEVDDEDTVSDEKRQEGPPALESEDQAHVFFFYVGGGTEVDIIEHYIGELEGAPNELKCLSNERDFKADLTPMQNVVLAFGLSQRTVVLCTQEFVDNEYESFLVAVNLVMTDEEKKLKIYVLLPHDVDLPKGLQKNKVFELSDEDALAGLTRVLCSGAVPKELYKTEPTAPPLDTVADDGSGDTPPAVEAPKEPALYQNGTVVKRITADNYKEFEFFGDEDSYRACRRCFGDCDAFCPLPEPQYQAPQQLRKRGLLVQQEEFQEILQALSDASRVKFFHKAVDCSLPCLYLCIMLVAVALLAPIWFLSVGVVKHNRPQEDHSSAIFWSFLLCVIILPALVALAALLLLMHLANAKYTKFCGKIEEFNKRFRETNLVLHSRKAYWYCSGRLKLFFIYYNFEECQQNLYYQVYEHMKYTGNGSTCNSSTTGHTIVGSDLNGNGHVPSGNGMDVCSHGDFEQDIPTLKMDKILKRVNTLKKKYEWDYFEELTTKKLPDVEERQHRKSGMCFCQYVLRRNMHDDPISWAEMVKERCESTLKNAFRKSHVRRQLRKSTNLNVNGSTSVGSNGTVRHSKPDIVYI